LNQRNYRVLIVDQSTGNLAELMPQADIIVSGTGQANLIRGDMIKAGAVIIDAGTSETNAGIVGDIDFESVQSIAAIVSPVPGGVGPVTVAKLLENVVQAAETKRL
jgi:methylenetetrahydrofolate dehydrogenase (NADP+)/methenyltetrahydrofolate cyclohydrolase